MTKTKTKILLSFLIILDLCLVAVFVVLYIFTKNQITDTINNTNQIITEIKRQETLSLMKKDVEDSKNYENKIYGYFIGADNVADFLKTVEGLVASSSLKDDIQSVDYESPSTVASVNTELLRVKVSVEGEWKNIQYFLKLVENYPLKIDIRNLSLNKVSDSVISGRKVSIWSANVDFMVVKLRNI